MSSFTEIEHIFSSGIHQCIPLITECYKDEKKMRLRNVLYYYGITLICGLLCFLIILFILCILYFNKILGVIDVVS